MPTLVLWRSDDLPSFKAHQLAQYLLHSGGVLIDPIERERVAQLVTELADEIGRVQHLAWETEDRRNAQRSARARMFGSARC